MKLAGIILFWLLWPLIWVYAPLKLRARVLIMYKDEFLVVKPYFGSGFWQLPGGGVGINEDAQTAAKREVFEETGIDLSHLILHTIEPSLSLKEKGLNMRYALFSVVLTKKPKVDLQPREILTYTWLKISHKTYLDFHVAHAVQRTLTSTKH